MKKKMPTKKRLAINKAIAELKDKLNQKGATHREISAAIDKIHNANDQPNHT